MSHPSTFSEPGASTSIDRRALLGGVVALVGLAMATPYLAQPFAVTPDAFIPFIDAVSDTLIPGSRATQPGAFIAAVLPSTWRGLTLDHVKTVSLTLNSIGQGDFGSAPLIRRIAALSALDATSFGQAQSAGVDTDVSQAWKQMKRALLSAYYTSEKGGADDLRFELVPGRWDADIPLSQAPRLLSNDWLGIWFS